MQPKCLWMSVSTGLLTFGQFGQQFVADSELRSLALFDPNLTLGIEPWVGRSDDKCFWGSCLSKFSYFFFGFFSFSFSSRSFIPLKLRCAEALAAYAAVWQPARCRFRGCSGPETATGAACGLRDLSWPRCRTPRAAVNLVAGRIVVEHLPSYKNRFFDRLGYQRQLLLAGQWGFGLWLK